METVQHRRRTTDLTKSPAIYHRAKNPQTGKWLNPKRIKEGKGQHTSDLKPPFSIRPVINGRQVWRPLAAQTFAEAKAEASRFYAGLKAEEQGIAVPEIEDANRTTLAHAVQDYLEHKEHEKGLRPRSIKAYRTALNEFADNVGARYMDEITERVLRNYLRFMREPVTGERRGYSAKTINTRMTIIFSLLKKHRVEARVDLPDVAKKIVRKYSPDEIQKLFAAMTDEEKFRYGFFLDTACREQEVQFATWADIDWDSKEFIVTGKPEVGFEPKDHEERRIPLSDDMLAQLKRRTKNPVHPRWIFSNGDNNPESHFLDKFKRIALRAGVNCGHCVTSRNEGKGKQPVEVTCKTHPVCEKMILHRLRKTTATAWNESRVPMRTIQHWLGHSSLEITQNYLGVTDSGELRLEINATRRRIYGD
jgi:integrase